MSVRTVRSRVVDIESGWIEPCASIYGRRDHFGSALELAGVLTVVREKAPLRCCITNKSRVAVPSLAYLFSCAVLYIRTRFCYSNHVSAVRQFQPRLKLLFSPPFTRYSLKREAYSLTFHIFLHLLCSLSSLILYIAEQK